MSTPPPYTDIDAAMAVYVEDDLSGEDSPPQSPQAPSSVRGIHHGVVGGGLINSAFIFPYTYVTRQEIPGIIPISLTATGSPIR